jgi:transposase
MESIKYLEQLLGIAQEFKIVKVEQVKTSEKIIRIYLRYDENYCLVAGRRYAVYDLAPEREWQHLNCFEYKCYIVCRLPRYVNEENKVRTYQPNFALSHKSYTNLFKEAVIKTLQQIRVQSQVASLYKTTPYIVRSIMEDAVETGLSLRGELTDFKHISVDEKSYAKGHEYATIVMDSDKEYIMELHEGREEKSLKALLYNISGREDQPQLSVVNMDMWQPYQNVIEEIAPQAIIVHDKFHVVKKLSEAVDSTRKKEVKENDLLIKQKYNLLKNEHNRSATQKQQFEAIDKANLKTSQAWHIRENFKLLWNYINVKDATGLIQTWMDESRQKAIYHVNLVLKTIEKHIKGIAAAITTRTTSALHENTNGKLQAIIAKARGFANFDRFRINALFYFGNLNFFPLKF